MMFQERLSDAATVDEHNLLLWVTTNTSYYNNSNIRKKKFDDFLRMRLFEEFFSENVQF